MPAFASLAFLDARHEVPLRAKGPKAKALGHAASAFVAGELQPNKSKCAKRLVQAPLMKCPNSFFEA